jgi:hypothetical protein
MFCPRTRTVLPWTDVGNKPTGPWYEIVRIGLKLTSKKIHFSPRFTTSVYVIKTNQLMLFMEIIDD